MPDQNEERKLDDLLDSALSTYSAVEPRPGLEGRILAHVRDAAEQPRAKWWNASWLVAGAVGAAIAVLVLSVLLLRHEHAPQQVQVQREHPAMSHTQPENRVSTNQPQVHKKNRPHRAERRQELARKDRPAVFPTPTGLSEQEKLMLVYLAQTPKEELIAQLRTPDPKEEEEFWKNQQPAAARPQR